MPGTIESATCTLSACGRPATGKRTLLLATTLEQMAIMDTTGDSDIMRVWALLSEVSEQLAQNRNASISLHSLAGGVKVSKAIAFQVPWLIEM